MKRLRQNKKTRENKKAKAKQKSCREIEKATTKEGNV